MKTRLIMIGIAIGAIGILALVIRLVTAEKTGIVLRSGESPRDAAPAKQNSATTAPLTSTGAGGNPMNPFGAMIPALAANQPPKTTSGENGNPLGAGAINPLGTG